LIGGVKALKEHLKEKEFKVEKIEKAEKLEKAEKTEIKEKEKEKVEIKETIKEHKELQKEQLEKQFDKRIEKQLEKQFDKQGEGGFGGGGLPQVGELEARLGALETAVTQLTHFISAHLRPDLSQGALTGEEEDVSGMQQQLDTQGIAAKREKENREQ
jgi:hypothetical protein